MKKHVSEHGYPWFVDSDFDVEIIIECDSIEGILLSEEDVKRMAIAIEQERLDNERPHS